MWGVPEEYHPAANREVYSGRHFCHGRMKRFLSALFLLGAPACSDPIEPAGASPDDRLGVWVPDPHATLVQSVQSKLVNPTAGLVESRSAWAAMWSQAWGPGAPPLPEIDFVLASVVVVGLGKRTGQGYLARVDSIVVHTTGAVGFATEILPGDSCAPSGEFSPVHMVWMPGHPPVFEWRIGSLRRACMTSFR